MTPTQFLRILRARQSMILLAILACLGAAVLAGKVIPARFKATSRVMLDVVKPDPVTGEIIASGFARAYVKTQIELIKDYRVAGRAADILGWPGNPQLAAQYQRRGRADKRDFRRWLAQRIIAQTSASLLEGSNILEIAYTSANAENAAKVADALRRAYLDQAIAFKREDAADAAFWFQRQTGEVRTKLTEAEERLNNFQRENGIVLDQDMIDQQSKRLAALAASAPAAPVASAAPIASGGNPMAAQLAEADSAIAAAGKTLGPNNPQMIEMQRRRAAIAAAAVASAPRVTRAMSVSGPSLESLFGSQQAKVLAQRGLVDEARRYATDVAVLRDQYQKTAAKAADYNQQAQALDSGLTLLGSATPPTAPSFPNWPLLIIGSTGLGAAVGILAALIAELLGRRVRGVEDLRVGSVAALGAMASPASAAGARAGWRFWQRRRDTAALRDDANDVAPVEANATDGEAMSAASNGDGDGDRFLFGPKVYLASAPESIEAESLRALRGVVLAQHVRDGRRALAICAPAEDAGCSFVAANLAVGMSQAGVNTLLIDANLRDPAIKDYIVGGDSNQNLVKLLRQDQLPLSHAVQRVQPALSVLFAGQAGPDDVEKLGGTIFQELIASCMREYDLVIVDTPPANRFADCRRIASIVRYALVVARRQRSYASDVRQLVEELGNERSIVIGTFLNEY